RLPARGRATRNARSALLHGRAAGHERHVGAAPGQPAARGSGGRARRPAAPRHHRRRWPAAHRDRAKQGSRPAETVARKPAPRPYHCVRDGAHRAPAGR
nr:hypothetical protein [Tanacetum cinerariifolium]